MFHSKFELIKKRRAEANPVWHLLLPSILGVFCLGAPNILIAADATIFEGQSILDNSLAANGVQLDDRGRVRLEKTTSGYKSNGEIVLRSIKIDGTRTYRLNWIEQWTAPQTWSKDRRNPIFGPKQTGKWDNWTNGVSVVQEKNGKRLKMYYSGKEGGGIGFATGLTSTPTYWREHPSSPVLKPNSNWEGNKINQPRVVKVTDQHWRMYYTGWGYEHANGGTKWAFNLAESFDGGTTWERHDVGPLMKRGDRGSPDGGGIFVPEVRQVNGKWMMWYTAAKIGRKQQIHLCLATSDDGVAWRKYANNPVLTDDFEKGPKRNVISRCCVRYSNGVYRMWYSHARPDYRIKYAESLDGIDWEASTINPVLDVGPGGAWDSQTVEYPEVLEFNGVWNMWYAGNAYGRVGYAFGVPEVKLEIAMRSSSNSDHIDKNTDLPRWSPWRPMRNGEFIQNKSHIQFRVRMSSKKLSLSPALNKIRLIESIEQ